MELISYPVKYKRAFEASAALKDYFLTQIEQRRSKPTEDIIGDLVTAEIDGEKLSDEAIYSFLRLLLPAGLETTYRSSGNLLFLLLTHPEQFQAVQGDHELIAPAIEEGLRFETPLTTVQRYATEDTELEGVKIPEGAVIDVCIGSANRDERRWERSEEFDIFRKRAAAHLLCRGRAHVHGAAPGPDGDPGRPRMPARPFDRHPLVTDDDPHIYGSAVPLADRRFPVTFDRAGVRWPSGRAADRADGVNAAPSAPTKSSTALRSCRRRLVDNLSMPLLAKHLDVGVTSIYWYFRHKDDLLDAMTDRVLHEYEFTEPSIDAYNWRESLRDHAQTMRQTFRGDPILCDLILIRGHVRPRCGTRRAGEDRAAGHRAGRGGAAPEQGSRDLRGDLGAHPRIGGAGAAAGEDGGDFPAQATKRSTCGFAEATDFDYIGRETSFDHAETLIERPSG